MKNYQIPHRLPPANTVNPNTHICTNVYISYNTLKDYPGENLGCCDMNGCTYSERCKCCQIRTNLKDIQNNEKKKGCVCSEGNEL